MNFGNIGLNYFFDYGLSLCVWGSAAGTLAAEVLERDDFGLNRFGIPESARF